MFDYLLIAILSIAMYVALKWLTFKGFVYVLILGVVAMCTIIITGWVDGSMTMSTVIIFLNSITLYAWIQILATRGKRKFAFISDMGILLPRTGWAIVGSVAFMYFSSAFVKSGQGFSIPDIGKQELPIEGNNME